MGMVDIGATVPGKGRQASSQASSALLTNDRVRTAALVLLIFTWEGVFAVLIGQPTPLHKYLVAAIIFPLAAYRLLIVAWKGTDSSFEIMSYGLFLLCLVVSFISNTWFFPQDIRSWVPAMFIIAPILLLPAARVVGIRPHNVVDALMIVGVSTSILIAADQIVHFTFMDFFVRGGSFDVERKAVLLKTETCCALLILFARWGGRMDAAGIWRLAGIFLISYNLFVVTESRLVTAAAGIALLLTIFIAFRGKARIALMGFAAVAAVVAVPTVLWRFVEQALAYGDFAEQDASASWRAKTFDYFYSHFEQTHGLGFGIMSTGEQSNNLIAWANQYGGLWLGAGSKYPLALADIGLQAALTQFGYLGLLVVVVMTLLMAARLMQSGKRYNDPTLFALGALALGYMISPLPMNFFTLDWSNMAGNLLWTLAALVSLRVPYVRPEAVTGSDAYLPPADGPSSRPPTLQATRPPQSA